MSAFIVSRETLNCVCSAMIGQGELISEATKIGRKLQAMNNDAIEDRYGHREALETFVYRPATYPVIQQFKSINCLIYQCSEGDVDEQPMYKRLTELRDKLALKIVYDLPAYDVATWDLREPIAARRTTDRRAIRSVGGIVTPF